MKNDARDWGCVCPSKRNYGSVVLACRTYICFKSSKPFTLGSFLSYLVWCEGVEDSQTKQIRRPRPCTQRTYFPTPLIRSSTKSTDPQFTTFCEPYIIGMDFSMIPDRQNATGIWVSGTSQVAATHKWFLFRVLNRSPRFETLLRPLILPLTFPDWAASANQSQTWRTRKWFLQAFTYQLTDMTKYWVCNKPSCMGRWYMMVRISPPDKLRTVTCGWLKRVFQ